MVIISATIARQNKKPLTSTDSYITIISCLETENTNTLLVVSCHMFWYNIQSDILLHCSYHLDDDSQLSSGKNTNNNKNKQKHNKTNKQTKQIAKSKAINDQVKEARLSIHILLCAI